MCIRDSCRSHQSCNMFSAMLSSILVPFLNQSGYRYRIENICLEPRAECNMPSAPEFRRILRTERLSEVFWKADTKQLSTSYNDIHTTGEFHIKLNHITDRCRKNHCSMIVCIMVKYLIYHQCHTVCYHHLFKESPEAVSYTHLDVYKRQPTTRTFFFRIFSTASFTMVVICGTTEEMIPPSISSL